MARKRLTPQINSGSMADIAFLLLIFFLVSTTISADKGMNRKLPKDCPPGTDCSSEINERNILRIAINKDKILVEETLVPLEELKNKLVDFLDNNGDGDCGYCNGNRIKTASDHPKKAVVSLKSNAQTPYELYIKVQDEIAKAYYQLRSQYVKQHFNKALSELDKDKLQQARNAYPFVLSEAETVR